MKNSIDYELRFSDATLLEADGDFDATKEIMGRELFSKGWMLDSNLEMVVVMGDRILEAFFSLHCYEDGKIYIMDYRPSSGDVYSNPDISGLSQWAGNNGWKSLIPHPDVVKGSLDFWKYFWETNLVDSGYLDKRYGKRDIIEESSNSE